jgi:hypothetical protein
MNRLFTTFALLALTACGAPADTIETADCVLPAIGDPCAMPVSKADALAIIEAAAYCPGDDIVTMDAITAEIAVCRSNGSYAVGEIGDDQIAYQIDDGSLVRCTAGTVTRVDRLMRGDIDGAPALFNVPADDCDAACRSNLALPSCR